MEYKFVSRVTNGANIGTQDRVEKGARALENGATNALRENAADAMRREEAEDISSYLRWTLLQYCRERGSMMDVGCFEAMAVDGVVS